MTILDQIIQRKKEEVLSAKSKIPLAMLKEAQFFGRKTHSLKASLKSTTGIIAEFKRQSPSKGIINNTSAPLEVVSGYERAGAGAVSILTDHDFFGGSLDDIMEVRNYIHIPVLRKDFMIDEYQFYEAKSIGADAVLLIAACLSPEQVNEFTALSHELGLEVLLEIHTETELGHYHSAIDMVGINNRNLKDFKVDLQHSVRLKDMLPEQVLSVAESGIYTVKDFLFLKEQGFDAFLMGEYFMKNSDPGQAFADFVSQSSHVHGL